MIGRNTQASEKLIPKVTGLTRLLLGPFTKRLTLIPVWISNHTPSKVRWNYLSILKH